MPRINLLPWREELRKERQQNFVIALGVTAAIGAGLVFSGKLYVESLISNQQYRNQFMQNEIAQVDKKLAEIKDLQATKQRLIARMKIIEQLQQSRPQIVHLFDEMVRTLPDGVYLNAIKQSGGSVSVQGIAESSARVAAYMRNIEASDWLKDPKLGGIDSKQEGRLRRSTFNLSMKQASVKSDEEADE